MNILHCSSDEKGGAGRAALRLHQALTNLDVVNSRMLVKNKLIDDWRIEEMKIQRLNALYRAANSIVDQLPLKLFRANEKIPRSTGWASMVSANTIDFKCFDVVHLHWICSGFLSIEEIGKIKSPLVWTLHDMWAFSGAEHLSEEAPNSRWRNGYPANAKSFFDLDRWVWLRKKRSWVNPIQMVSPSQWITNCVRESALMEFWDVTTIPNALDTDVYRPIPKAIAREILGLPLDVSLVLYGAIGGTHLPYKGWDLLLPALSTLSSSISGVEAVVIGQSQPQQPYAINLPIHWMGHIHDDVTLALIYSAVDLTVIPSRQEAFGQVGSEAQACGCPVVAFNATGLKDVVEHKVTGYLAKPYCIEDLRQGMVWTLENSGRSQTLSEAARARALAKWSPEVVVPQYIKLYEKVINQH